MKILKQKLEQFIFKEKNPHNPTYVKKLQLFQYNRSKQAFMYPNSLWNKNTILFIPNKEDLLVYKYLKSKPNIDWSRFEKQWNAVEKLLVKHYWLLTSWVWSWKTIMMALATEILLLNWEKVIISSPKKQVDKQIYEEFKEIFWNEYKVELFNSKKKPEADILVINHTSLHKYYNVLQDYTAILIDEAHMNHTKKRVEFGIFHNYDYLYWFTWTPELNEWDDKVLIKFYWDYVVDSWLRPSAPKIRYFKFVQWRYFAWDWHELVDEMYWNEDRLIQFVKIVYDVMQRPDRTMWIVFVDRKDIAYWLEYVFNEIWLPAMVFIWDHSLQKRDEILKELTPKRWLINSYLSNCWCMI